MDSRTFFETIYRADAPWDVGAAQPSMLELLREWPPSGPVLDVGCGTGDLAIELARNGLDVLGIDFIEAAIAVARDRAARAEGELEGSLEFRVGDALRPSALGRTFGAVVDSGFFHVFEAPERLRLAGELAAVVRPGGLYYLHAFAVEFPIPNTPRIVTERELQELFTQENGWRILGTRPAEFHSRVAPPVPALTACVERSRVTAR